MLEQVKCCLTPRTILYLVFALSCSIKDLGKSSPFRKTERGKFEAIDIRVLLPNRLFGFA